MRIAFFVHSAVSDWNHGNAHFLRGLMDALVRQGHEVTSWEPRISWSAEHLLRDAGPEAIVHFARAYPALDPRSYDPAPEVLRDRLEEAVSDRDLVIVHEWTDPAVVDALMRLRRPDGPLMLFHDTHHRAVSEPDGIRALRPECFDLVLAFGRSLARVYDRDYGVPRVRVLHEAADTVRFRPLERDKEHDVVWIGNWGDEERSAELRSYWLTNARALPGVRFVAHGVRYPAEALDEVQRAGVRFRGRASSLDVPEIFARSRVTLHVPRRIYPETLPGIPTIRVFEALACGIPLVSAPWPDDEALFRAGDYRAVASPLEARDAFDRLVHDEDAARRQAEQGLATIRARHTCDHRARELLEHVAELAREGSDIGVARKEAACA